MSEWMPVTTHRKQESADEKEKMRNGKPTTDSNRRNRKIKRRRSWCFIVYCRHTHTHTHVYLMLAMWLFLPRENFFFFLYLLASVTVHLELTQEERINFDSIPKGALFKCSSWLARKEKRKMCFYFLLAAGTFSRKCWYFFFYKYGKPFSYPYVYVAGALLLDHSSSSSQRRAGFFAHLFGWRSWENWVVFE